MSMVENTEGKGAPPAGGGVCPLNSAGVSSCVAAPQTPAQKKQQCLANIYKTPFGKALQFGSALSFIDDLVGTAVNWGEAISTKTILVRAFQAGANSAAPEGTISPVAKVAGPLAKGLGKVGVGLATLTDAGMRAGCAVQATGGSIPAPWEVF